MSLMENNVEENDMRCKEQEAKLNEEQNHTQSSSCNAIDSTMPDGEVQCSTDISDLSTRDKAVNDCAVTVDSKEDIVVDHINEGDGGTLVKLTLDGIPQSTGVLFIRCKGDGERTNPDKITEWFSSGFLTSNRIYAIKEDEPFLLKLFTRNHEAANRGIRKKGGRKVMFMGHEVFGDILLACGHCGYYSHEGSNVRRHLKKSVCLKDRGYTKEDLKGLDKVERRKFLRRLAAVKCRAKKRALAAKIASEEPLRVEPGEIIPQDSFQHNFSVGMTSNIYPDCIVEIQESCRGNGATTVHSQPIQQLTIKPRRRPPKPKALMLGPVTEKPIVERVPYDVFVIDDKCEMVAWKPSVCHKAGAGDKPCQIVFKGARMRRRCMDLPVPIVLVYRKLDCKTHHCNFTLFHPSAQTAFRNDSSAKASVNVKMYGDTVMTQDFYHYFVSLMSVMKMKSSQTARHLTGVWETIITERLGTPVIPEEHRKVLTLSKQTVKSIWASIEEEAGSKGGLKLTKTPKRKKKASHPTICAPPPPPPPPPLPPPPPPTMPHSIMHSMSTPSTLQPALQQPCMKRINPKPPGMPPPPPPKPPMLGPTPTHNPMQQPAHPPVSHTHWLGQAPQYTPNMTTYAMAPAGEYYPMPGHFMAQYTAPASIGTSP